MSVIGVGHVHLDLGAPWVVHRHEQRARISTRRSRADLWTGAACGSDEMPVEAVGAVDTQVVAVRGRPGSGQAATRLMV